jgi:hypothetical protein
MPKPLSAKGSRAAKAYAANFMLQYKAALKAALKKLADKTPSSGVGGKRGNATGDRASAYKNTPFSTRRGCQTASVRLHPHGDSYLVELGGSDAQSTIPAAIVDIKGLFPGESFISGHVINAEFGGDGADPGNQTILTTGANSQHHFDESVKSAWQKMTKAWEEMYRFAQGPAGRKYMNDLRGKWAIQITGTVDAVSWYDRYITDVSLASHPNMLKSDPLDCVTTQVVFTATEVNAPTEEDMAKNLKIDDQRTDQLARDLSEFRQFMIQAQRFELNQPPPATFAGRSQISASGFDDTGKVKPFTSNAWKNTLKPKGAPKTPKKVAPTVQSYLTTESGAIINLADGDNEVGARTRGYPWTAAISTALKAGIIFIVYTDKAGGPAYVSREGKNTTKIDVNGTPLAGKPLSLDVGQVLRVHDNQEPVEGYYDLTFGQK